MPNNDPQTLMPKKLKISSSSHGNKTDKNTQAEMDGRIHHSRT